MNDARARPQSFVMHYFTALVVAFAAVIVLTITRSVYTGSIQRIDLDAEQLEVLASGWTTGPETAVLTIFEFGDYQCPFCLRSFLYFQRIREQYPDQIRMVLLHFPLESHSLAMPAALAVECADDQGRYGAFRAELFSRIFELENASWVDVAQAALVADTAAFMECFRSERYRSRVERHKKLGKQLGVNGTPAYLIDGVLHQGFPDPEKFSQWLAARLNRKP